MTTVQHFFPLDWEATWKQERGCHMNVVAGIHTFVTGFFFQVCVAAGVFFNNNNKFILRFDVFCFMFYNGYKSIHQREASHERVDLYERRSGQTFGEIRANFAWRFNEAVSV
jgi:hypothetical protein